MMHHNEFESIGMKIKLILHEVLLSGVTIMKIGMIQICIKKLLKSLQNICKLSKFIKKCLQFNKMLFFK